MKKSKQETVQTRQNIVESASKQFRKKGIAATGLSEIMEQVGLTHGGFYRHFESKDQLIHEALQFSSDSMNQQLEDTARLKTDKSKLESILKSYLSQKHRDHSETGCPFAGMGSELSRTEATTRSAATEGIQSFISLVMNQFEDPTASESKTRATATVSMLVGALMLSRIVSEEKLSNEILKTAIQASLKLVA